MESVELLDRSPEIPEPTLRLGSCLVLRPARGTELIHRFGEVKFELVTDGCVARQDRADATAGPICDTGRRRG